MILKNKKNLYFLFLLSLLVFSMGCGWFSHNLYKTAVLAREIVLTVTPLATRTPTPTATHTPTATTTHTPVPTAVVLIGAGDISVCGLYDDVKTAGLIERLLAEDPQAEIFTAGDNVQINGDMVEFTDCFDPTWGKFRDRIHPSPGNHDWYAAQGQAYFDYFGEAAGVPGLGYYSYDLGAWHMVSLNSNCDTVRCDENSIQAQWLRADLQTNTSRCTLLYWHHPLWSSGLVPISPAAAVFLGNCQRIWHGRGG